METYTAQKKWSLSTSLQKNKEKHLASLLYLMLKSEKVACIVPEKDEHGIEFLFRVGFFM